MKPFNQLRKFTTKLLSLIKPEIRPVLLLISLFVFNTFILLSYIQAEKQVTEASDRRFRSYELADELRQSSDDLTRMVRTYLITGNSVYKAYYQEILDIRNGKKPRPINYQRVYWDLVISTKHRPIENGPAIPILELMRQVGFTDEEMLKLTEAKENSDELTIIEFKAMSLIEDKRNSTENLKAKAILMLFDENYHLAKAKIMKPINDFGNLMEARTLAKLKKMELYADQLQHLALLIDLILAIAAIRIHINTQRGKTIAAQTTQLKSEFIANMSHEIRTPMNAIIGLIDLILETELSEVQRKYLEKIQRSSSTLLGILNDILDISKIESGKIELEYIEFDPSRTLFEIAELFYFRAEEKGLKIFVEVDPNFASTIICDQLRFKQIISNLLGNAIKFTEFGQISVRLKILEKKTDQVILKIEITDTGIGIRKEDLAKLFRSFSQADTSITRKFGGTGLGLVISKQLIERMGGEIDVESIYGKGSTFAFTLPCKIGEMNLEKIPSEDSKIKKTTYYENAKPIAGAKVLLVEDNKLNQEVACAFLKKAGLSVSTAENGELAIDLINLHDFDCVLMDVQMPVLDGYEASGFIREKLNKKDLPIIAMTAAALQQDRDQCLAAGMNDHIGKPIRPDLLINILLKWIKPRKF